jgi:hypothetical protein
MTVPVLPVVPVIALGLTDVSLTIMLIGAIALTGATVVMTAIPTWRWPNWMRKRSVATPVVVHPPVAQRRVVTGRAPTLPPAGVPLPRQAAALPDGRRTTDSDVGRAEAIIDRFLESDPALLAATLSTLIALDDTPRRRHR